MIIGRKRERIWEVSGKEYGKKLEGTELETVLETELGTEPGTELKTDLGSERN